MQRVVLACLALCVAVAMSSPINSVSIGTQITNVRNDQAVLIDVSSDFTDIMNNQHIFQVAVGVTVQQGVVMLNGMRVARSVQSTVSFSALFREIEAGTNNVVNAHNVKVGVQALVQEQIVAGKLTSLSVQLLLSEVDGNLLHQVLVHEVVLFLNPQGAEQSRQSRTMGVAQSAITTTTTSSTTTGPVIGLDPTRSPSDTSSSDSPDETDGHMEKCRVRRFFHWVAKQPFGLRVLIYAALALFAIVVGKFLFCLFTVCCCPRRCPKTRTTYLDNVKLHYVPLSMDDAAYPDKKPLLI